MADNDHYSVAWEQFLIGKRAMLAEYQQAKSHSRNLDVQTWHGVAAESAFRAWLKTFLPKRFGVTAGYIKGQRLKTPYDYAHFDVIIYDELNAPVLWVESSNDKSEQGRSRIIPAEHVHAVLEVKSAFNARSVEAAAAKLRQLGPLTEELDGPGERYPTYLRASLVVGMVFFELRSEAARDVRALDIVRDLELRRSVYGAVILSGEGLHQDDTGIIKRTYMKDAFDWTPEDLSMLGNVNMSHWRPEGDVHVGSILTWSPIGFSDFAFDLLAIMSGTFENGRPSSLHGLDLAKLTRSGKKGS